MTAYRPPAGPPTPHRTPPDWRDMSRTDFDTDAPPDGLFTLEPSAVCVVDPCGTGDMLELIGE